MSAYHAPLKEVRFVLHELAGSRRPEAPRRREGVDRLDQVGLALPVVPDDEVQARVQLHPAARQVSETLGRERKNLHAADYILIGITT